MRYWDSSAIVPLIVGENLLSKAAAMVVRDGYGASLSFVCCDDRLQLAAEKEGLDVLRLLPMVSTQLQMWASRCEHPVPQRGIRAQPRVQQSGTLGRRFEPIFG